MTETPQSKTTFPSSDLDEKTDHLQQEVLAQDEAPDSIEAKKKEDALRRKLDRFVAPVMMMLMLISYLDRGNIGFAATQGMTMDIGLKGSQLNVSQSSGLEFGQQVLMRLCRLLFQSSTSSTSSQNFLLPSS
jgi:hypothetical protein